MGTVIQPLSCSHEKGYLNQMRIVETSPDRISDRRADSDFIFGLWRRRRRHLTRMIENLRRVVAFRRIVKDNVFGGA